MCSIDHKQVSKDVTVDIGEAMIRTVKVYVVVDVVRLIGPVTLSRLLFNSLVHVCSCSANLALKKKHLPT